MSKAEEAAPQKKNRTNFLLALVAVLAVIGIVISVYTLLAGENGISLGNENEEIGAPAGPFRQFGPLDFTVNLADSGQRNYLKATVMLGFEERSLAGELEERKAQIRDLIIDVLRSKAMADVNQGEQTEQLRSELIAELNGILNNGEIREIYFTDFLVQ